MSTFENSGDGRHRWIFGLGHGRRPPLTAAGSPHATKPPDAIGTFDERPFPRTRIPTLDALAWSRAWHHVPALMEVDVTVARESESSWCFETWM